MNNQCSSSRSAHDGAAAERERVRRVYRAYEAEPRYKRLWGDTPAHRFMQGRKWSLITRELAQDEPGPSGARILDLGSGGTGDAIRFGEVGWPPSAIVAFDLIPKNVRGMRGRYPAMSAVAGDAASLPFQDRSFKVVYQSTMISSLLDPSVRRAVLEEVDRVLAPGGVFLSYDVRYRNPWNPNTRPLKAADLYKAFSDWSLTVRSVTAIPQLLRLLAPVSIVACRLIESIPPLRTHLLVVARKPIKRRGHLIQVAAT
jgi:ubiquinone/menaquinone biosynthesis C-methylase UbiE